MRKVSCTIVPHHSCILAVMVRAVTACDRLDAIYESVEPAGIVSIVSGAARTLGSWG